VVVKAHPLHLGTSELVGCAIQQAVSALGLPEGVFSLLIDDQANAVSAALVQHPAIHAVAFTGSRRVGKILIDLAAKRPMPIPVYAEMSGINPVFLLPSALEQRAEEIARGFVDSMTLGSGQFCTKPGVVLGVAGSSFERLRLEAQRALQGKQAATMLAPGIHQAYECGVERWKADTAVRSLANGEAPAMNVCAGQARLFATTAQHFLASPPLFEEVFGPAALLIECQSVEELLDAGRSFEGQLTATLQMEDDDIDLARTLLRILERKAGRILVNGFPTGVEVSYAMVHGGPYPATSDGRSTSVGAMAIERFLRPVCYQNLPVSLLPETLRDGSAQHIPTLIY
jgi:NADP-dependent aldehyde dehydrogenase